LKLQISSKQPLFRSEREPLLALQEKHQTALFSRKLFWVKKISKQHKKGDPQGPPQEKIE